MKLTPTVLAAVFTVVFVFFAPLTHDDFYAVTPPQTDGGNAPAATNTFKDGIDSYFQQLGYASTWDDE